MISSMRGGGLWGLVLSLVLVLTATAMAVPAGVPTDGGPGPSTPVTSPVDNGTSVTAWERTTDMYVLTYSVATLMGRGGVFDSMASEHWSFTSGAVDLRIARSRPVNIEG